MFNSVAIQVSIGLVFVFLLYSLLATIFQEIFARWLGLRPRILKKGICRMLEDGQPPTRLTFINYLADFGQSFLDYFRPLKSNSFAGAFYNYPLIKYLGENNWSSKPSYLNPANFSTTIVNLLRGPGFNNSLNQMSTIFDNLKTNRFQGFTINPETQTYLMHLWTDSSNDADRFRFNLESWFNDTMARTSGWYKRQVQLMLFVIGFSLAASFNIDCIAIARILMHDKTARQQMIDLATRKYQAYGQVVANQDQRGKEEAPRQSAPDPDMQFAIQKARDDQGDAQNILGLGDGPNSNQSGKWHLFWSDKLPFYPGWLLTAFAISLGAPFWFDLLNKIMTLRAAGAKPGANGKKDKKKSDPTPDEIVG